MGSESMKHPRQKRINLRTDGYYYPQFRWGYIFWFDYDAPQNWCTSSTSVRFCTEVLAREWLDKRHMQELKEIAVAAQAKIVNWRHPA